MSLVECTTEGAVRILRLNRPEKLNAISADLADELQTELAAFRGDEAVRAGVVTGCARAFSTGGDISVFPNLHPESGYAFTRVGYEMYRALETCDKPLIAAVEGYCLAGGLELALACDFIIASETAVFGMSEIDLGLIPGWGGTVRLSRAIPVRRARQMLLTGERIAAPEALALGLVNEVVEGGTALDRALELARSIAAKPPLAVRVAKMTIAQAADAASTDAALAVERAGCALLLGSDDAQTLSRNWLSARTKA